MIAPGNYHLLIALTLGILISSGYAIGRIHQWHKDGQERDEAYRHGYDTASLSILNTVIRESPAAPLDANTSSRRRGRHVRTGAIHPERPKVHPQRGERVRAS
ncbi:hypothetical protein [Paractinoplanes durhamensis]|uniref:Uncharacterized protein n=1 Tax=Paractinoplanes durhamensis TaxID=113563 RepID=A0ABQ3YQE8_9ACTN|nr:hypothetical protein [Actinoplanes durhamensis]GID99786.1 hypothetical protein Adu01nite_11370 [Actinoplanes durhamensis]